jgi:hypothetical protein
VQVTPAAPPRPAAHRARPKVRHAPRKAKPRPAPAKPKPALPTPQLLPGAKSSAPAAVVTSPGGLGVAKPLIAFVLVLSVMLFGTAAVPAHAVRWRPAAQFIGTRTVDMTLMGVVLLAGAGVAMLLTGGH